MTTLSKNKKTKHCFFQGTAEFGKSNAIKELLSQICCQGNHAIIYDVNCNYLEKFYQSKPDRLLKLNPMHSCDESWHLCENEYDES